MRKVVRSHTIGVAAFAATGSFLFRYGSGAMTDMIASAIFLEFFNTAKAPSIVGAVNSTCSGGARLLYHPSFSPREAVY
jgi:hypothetical protein